MRFTSAILISLCLMTMPAWAVTCGDILGPGGVCTLTADLICEGDGPALTVRDGAVLDLGGHSVRSAILVILVEGKGATLQHGLAANLLSGEDGIAVQVQGEGGHTITGIQTDGIVAGVQVTSDRNHLTNNVCVGDVGFQLVGHHNSLRQNTVAGLLGFAVSGDGNRLIGNVSDTGPSPGFHITGSRNLLWGNTTMAVFEGFIIAGDQNLVMGNQGSGAGAISVSGEKNWLIRNTAVASEDGRPGTLTDTHGDCTHNRWIANTAASVDPPCILEGPLAVAQAH